MWYKLLNYYLDPYIYILLCSNVEIIIICVPQLTNNHMLLEEIIIYRHIISHNAPVRTCCKTNCCAFWLLFETGNGQEHTRTHTTSSRQLHCPSKASTQIEHSAVTLSSSGSDRYSYRVYVLFAHVHCSDLVITHVLTCPLALIRRWTSIGSTAARRWTAPTTFCAMDSGQRLCLQHVSNSGQSLVSSLVSVFILAIHIIDL